MKSGDYLKKQPYAEEAAVRDHDEILYRDLEAQVNEGVRVALQQPNAEAAMDAMLCCLGETLHSERVYIFEHNAAGNDDNTFEWVAPGVIPQKDSLQDLPGEVCAGWYQNFHQGKPIIIKDLEDIRDDQPMLYETLKRQDIRTLVVVPLYDGEMVVGFYGVDNPPLEYLTISTNILQLMSYFIVSNIRRRDLRLRLERASYLDELTGLGNRRAFIKRAAVCEEIQQIGCVVLDINNLKLCNDRYGHLAGDDLIRESAACIREAFEELGDCYRVGGDEFYVLLYSKDQSQIAEAVERLNQIVANKKADCATLISLAYGWGLRDSGETMEHLVNRCDERMYDMKYRMKEEYSTYREERMQTYLSILEFLSSSTNDYLFLLDIPKDENRFFGGIDRYYAIREPGKRTNTTKQLLNMSIQMTGRRLWRICRKL